jgi:hypothetical protein
MTTLQSLAHDVHISSAVEGKIGTPACEFDYCLYDLVRANSRGIHKIGHSKFFSNRLLRRIDIYSYDLVGTDHSGALQNIQSDCTKPEDDYVSTRPDLGSVYNRANTGSDAASDIADFLSKGASSRTLATAISSKTVKFENVEQPM